MKNRLIYLTLLITLGWSCDGEDNPHACPDAKCADYATQQQAQAAYDSDPRCMDALDNDNDQIACEDLSSDGGTGSGGGAGGNGCPTTSNCGCSNKNKSQCGGACCQWIVGTGCRCR